MEEHFFVVFSFHISVWESLIFSLRLYLMYINIGRTDAEAETPILWPPHAKSWLIGKDPDAGRDWGQEEKGTTEDEMAGWHHQLDGHEFEWTPGVGDGQGGLACCDSWGRKESDTTEQLNWTLFYIFRKPFFWPKNVGKGCWAFGVGWTGRRHEEITLHFNKKPKKKKKQSGLKV